MVIYRNELGNLPKTEEYVKFGLKQVDIINKKFDSWLVQQTFAKDVVSSKFENMIIRGNSKGTLQNKEIQDTIEWELEFLDKVKNEHLSNALLHIHRLPNIKTFNSKPGIFDTADYIHISAFNGERGWVETGKFPKNVHAEKDYDAFTEENIHKELPIIGIQTDVRREALAGFNAAYHWQCFRAMAVTCSDFITTQLREEGKKLDSRDFDGWNHMRSRRENLYPFFVGLLPDTRLEKGPSALKPFYRPGVLEGAFALELEKFVYHQFGNRETGGVRPIWNTKSNPIDIIQNTKRNYDALIKFGVNISGYCREDKEQVKSAVEKQLQKSYNLNFKSPSDVEVVFELKNANKVEQKIKEGATDTELHKFVKNFVNALIYVQESCNLWEKDELPRIKKEYEDNLNNSRIKHFSGLEEKIVSRI